MRSFLSAAIPHLSIFFLVHVAAQSGEPCEDGFPGAFFLEKVAQAFVMEDEGDSREEMQVRFDGGTDNGEKGEDGVAVEGAVGDRFFEKGERHHGARHMQDDRGAGVGDGDAFSEAGGHEFLTREQHFQEEIPVDFMREAKQVDDGAESGGFVAPLDAVENAALLESFAEGGETGVLHFGFLEDGWGDMHLAGGVPL